MKEIKVEFKTLGNFSCTLCGKCCFGQKLGANLFYQEVVAIRAYLKRILSTNAFEQFTWDYCTAMGSAEKIGDEDFLQEFRIWILDFFFCVAQETSIENVFCVKHYVLKFLRDSQRCVFLNPLDNRCLIHEVKPIVCRLYPFYAEYDSRSETLRLGEYSDGCEGLLSNERYSALQQDALEFQDLASRHRAKHAELLQNAGFAADNLRIDLKRATEAEMEQRYDNIKKATKRAAASSKTIVRDLFVESRIIEPSDAYLERLKNLENCF